MSGLSAPTLSWDAILKMTKMELELIPDPDMYIFFEKVLETEFPVFPIDTVRPATNI